MPKMYVYSRVGRDERIEVLRYPTELENEPLPGGDVPTTPGVGIVVAHSVVRDASGNPMVLALDPTPTQREATTARDEGWEAVPDDDPLRSDVPGVVPDTA